MSNQEKIEEILNKKFKKSIFSGYDTLDVDEFFDLVCEYLKANDKRVKEAEENAAKLKAENDSLNEQLQKVQQELSVSAALLDEYRQNGYDNLKTNKFKDSNDKEGK